MTISLRLFFLASLVGVLSAQPRVWQPSPGHTQIPLWPGAAAASDIAVTHEAESVKVEENLVAGKPWTGVYNVSLPTMTVYSPSGKNTGVAVLVFPGGGYQMLAIDLEGSEVCDWLSSKGVTCIVLKYRVPGGGPSHDPRCNCRIHPEKPMALQDAQRAMGLIRQHAAEWNIDPHKVGVLGFSAGGHLSTAISTHFAARLYPPVDAADKLSCRPDFSVVLYPGHLWVDEKKFQLVSTVPVTKQTPPTIIVQAENDDVDNINNSLVYYIALKNAGVPAEVHFYAEGRHAFGLRRTKFPITAWPQLVETWLHTIGMVTD